MSEFHKFSALIRDRFEDISKHELYVLDVDKDTVWDAYLAAFPEGSNPIYRERAEHDCSCCKQFVRNVGNVVAIIDGRVESVWAVEGAEYPYATVAETLTTLVEAKSIKTVFRAREGAFGAAHTIELLEGNQTKKWHHFVANVERRHQCDDVDAAKGRILSVAQVFRRGLEELTIDAFNTVVDLINANALYRGQEFSASVSAFYALKTKYDDPATNKEVFVWQHVNDSAARFRNSVIGTLVTDLSDGVDVERAVSAFESKVAPTNYKRPTALITPRMVDDAMETIKELGLEPALDRRFAKLSDVSVNNVLFVDNSVQATMKDGVHGLLMEAAAPRTPKLDNAVDIGVDEFMQRVLPTAKGIDVMLTNSAARNFMSLTAPVHDRVASLFKWDNNFAWSYDGNVTDTIKEKVKRAGGNVDATLRVSLAWYNYDDLDIHVNEPNGNHIFFGNKSNKLDVDMNAGGRASREPVENVSWIGRVPDGLYLVSVNQYHKRESADVGFMLEVEYDGVVQTFTYDRAVTGTVKCLALTVNGGALTSVDLGDTHVVAGSAGVEKWGVVTEQLVPVDTIMASPNHWDGNATGNKHWFFMLNGCKNPEPTRGIYNEFLKPELEKHRKVFEVLGSKTKCPVVDEQLSGVGFSSTRKDSVIVVVRGDKTQKVYNVTF